MIWFKKILPASGWRIGCQGHTWRQVGYAEAGSGGQAGCGVRDLGGSVSLNKPMGDEEVMEREWVVKPGEKKTPHRAFGNPSMRRNPGEGKAS